MANNFQNWLSKVETIDSILGIIGVVVILGAALFMQIFHHEQPCPLCLLQRVAFVNIGLGLLLNLRYGTRVSHWALVILSAFAGMCVSIRQILLHITTVQGFGSAVGGLHMYTWCFIGFSLAIAGSVIMLLVYPQKQG